ncbi:MAG TPA: hypothetical protein VLH77_02575, partial [Gammaproteobacteria bacterium]|nr:hypothetical protein [Gammaproteobacteria bacterium]
MTTELKIFVERYKQLTPNLLEHCDPLAKFGLHTDRSETLAKKIAAMCGGQGSTYILDDQLQIASDQTSNTIKINIDAFLKIHYPREIGNTVIREVPEFIIRTLRLLILNIEFHLKENHVEQKKHFEYVKEICLYLIETNNIWVPENKGLFSFGNSPGQELSSAFCTLCETVLKDIDVKIEQLAATLKVNTLPNAVEELKTVEKNLTILFSRFLLLHIASKDIPEDFFINDALNKLFADKDLTFQKLTSSNLREDIKNVFQSDERQAFSRSREEISQGIFHLVKFAFIGTERSKIRKDMTSSFILHVKRELNARALQTVAQTPQRQLTNAHPAEEKKTEIAAKSDTPTITSSALTSVTPSSSVTLDRHSLPAETQKFAEQYHARVQLDTQSRALVVNALPECIRKIYNNPDPTVHTEAMINSVKLYVDVIMTGLLTLEELIHARINLSYTKNYSLRGGPFLTKASMPVPNTAGSILSTLNKIKLVIHELRKIDIKSVVPGLSHGFIGNNRMALATGYRISKEIDTKGNNGIQNIQLSISPHEIEQDADDMFENLAGSVLCQTAMQGLTMSKSPIFDATIAMLSAAKAISFKNQLEHKAADDRVSNFKNTLPMGIPVPRQLTYTDHGFRPIQELRKLTSSDFENSFLRNYALTIGQALAGTIVHNASQPYLQVTTEGGNILDYPLDESGKRWIEEKQKPALPPRPPQSILTSASSSSSSTHTASSTSTENTSTSVSSSYLNLASAPSTAPQSQTSPSSSSAPSAFTSTTTIAGSSSASPAEIKYFPPACDDQSEILLLLADNRERTLRNEILHRDQKLLDHSQDWNIKIMKLKFWYFFPGLGIPLIILSPVLIGA